MRTRKHLIYGSLFAVACYFLFDIVGFTEAFVIWICSWFIIDLDHAVRYSIRTGDFNPYRFFKFGKEFEKIWKRVSREDKKKYKNPLFMFHGIESLLVLFILSFWWEAFFWCFIGFLFHLILDWVNLYVREEGVLAKVSVIYVLIRNRKKKSIRIG